MTTLTPKTEKYVVERVVTLRLELTARSEEEALKAAKDFPIKNWEKKEGEQYAIY